MILCCREKPLASSERPVPQTNSGGQVENTEAIERTVVKELGKMPPQLREKGGHLLSTALRGAAVGGRRDQ